MGPERARRIKTTRRGLRLVIPVKASESRQTGAGWRGGGSEHAEREGQRQAQAQETPRRTGPCRVRGRFTTGWSNRHFFWPMKSLSRRKTERVRAPKRDTERRKHHRKGKHRERENVTQNAQRVGTREGVDSVET